MDSVISVAKTREIMLEMDFKSNQQCVVEMARTSIFKKIKFVGRGDAKLPVDNIVAKLLIKAMGWGTHGDSSEEIESNWNLYRKDVVVAINNKHSTCAYMMKDAFMCKICSFASYL